MASFIAARESSRLTWQGYLCKFCKQTLMCCELNFLAKA